MPKQMTITVLILIMVVVGLFVLATTKKSYTTNKPIVVASFYQISQIVKYIAGDKVELVTLIPSGVEPHDYELTASDIINLHKANIVFSNGILDNWLTDQAIDPTSAHVNIVTFLPKSKLLYDSAGNIDPHYWGDSKLLIQEAEIIATKLATIDSNNNQYYLDNFNKFKTEVELINSKNKINSTSCKQNTIITYHRAYDYLSKELALNSFSIIGYNEGAEISPTQLIELDQLIKKNHIKYLLADPVEDLATASRIAENNNITVLRFSTLEGSLDNTNLLDLYQQNFNSLLTALECQKS
jgi:zinc transport system substrate-binding protein